MLYWRFQVEHWWVAVEDLWVQVFHEQEAQIMPQPQHCQNFLQSKLVYCINFTQYANSLLNSFHIQWPVAITVICNELFYDSSNNLKVSKVATWVKFLLTFLYKCFTSCTYGCSFSGSMFELARLHHSNYHLDHSPSFIIIWRFILAANHAAVMCDGNTSSN